MATPLQHISWDKVPAAKLKTGSAEEIESVYGVKPLAETLDPKKLKCVQDYLRPANFERIVENPEYAEKPIVVARTLEGDIVIDGNHRASFALLRGDPVKADVFDLRHPPEPVQPKKTADASAGADDLLDKIYGQIASRRADRSG